MENVTTSFLPSREQRRSRRYRSTMLVDLQQATGRKERLRTVDVCRHGLFVTTDRPPPERFLVRLTIYLPDGPLAATAFVSRSVTRDDPGGGGIGLQLFALAAASKARWDQFIFAFEGNRASPRQLEREVQRDRAPEDATFLIKLKDVTRLHEFYEKNIGAGGLYMATPVIKEAGAEVALIIIHPVSEQEFILVGKVARVCREPPKGMEIKLNRLSPADDAEFRRFIGTGISPDAPVPMKAGSAPAVAPVQAHEGSERAPKPAPVPAPRAPSRRISSSREMGASQPRGSSVAAILARLPPPIDETASAETGDISLDIVVDESLLEESRSFDWNEISDEDLIIDFDLSDEESVALSPPPDVAVDAAAPLSPAEAEDRLRALIDGVLDPELALRTTCGECGHTGKVVTLGGFPGVLGTLTSRRPYWCPKCEALVAVTRLKPSIARRKVIEAIGRLGPTVLDQPIALRMLLEVTALVGASPKCPTCAGHVRVNGIVKSVETALLEIAAEPRARLKRAKCAACKKTALFVEKAG